MKDNRLADAIAHAIGLLETANNARLPYLLNVRTLDGTWFWALPEEEFCRAEGLGRWCMRASGHQGDHAAESPDGWGSGWPNFTRP